MTELLKLKFMLAVIYYLNNAFGKGWPNVSVTRRMAMELERELKQKIKGSLGV